MSLLFISAAAAVRSSFYRPYRYIYFYREFALFDIISLIMIFALPSVLYYASLLFFRASFLFSFFPTIILSAYIFYLLGSNYTTFLAGLRRRSSKQNRLAEWASKHDLRTGLFNRSAFDEISASHKSNSISAILMVDIDRFKAVNDNYGHFVGDAVIENVSRIIQRSVRSSDICVRWGGEEYLVLLDNCTRENAQVVAEKIRSSVEASNTRELPAVTVSIGGAMRHNMDLNFDEVAREADRNLYIAKRAGRNRVSFGGAELAPTRSDVLDHGNNARYH
ncbi:GGDEF domain-containing protein [Roseicyclus marinus]|uniref:GGDEF domain-containing protein n=1 Tax=Roseicyclus marinus TaxID=2161673 RepID=UPI00240FB9E1|nr:GGDEF domain-containing protein [Roseicyclus marinus]MDG3040521.1 GGDEF domain-containing protein [Roseicyclus marinus]